MVSWPVWVFKSIEGMQLIESLKARKFLMNGNDLYSRDNASH